MIMGGHGGLTSTTLCAFTRQVNDSIMVRRLSDSKDKLLYDFGVEIGDTVTVPRMLAGPGFSIFKVTNVDTISIFGKNRRRIWMEDSDSVMIYNEDIWIEGIGSILRGYFARGLPSFMYFDFYFTCFYSADVDSFWNDNSSGTCKMASLEFGCKETTSSPEPDISPQFTLYPNPFSDYIQIENQSVNGVVKIYNTLGQEISNYPIDNQSLKINTSFLSPGVYILSIQDDSGNILNKKMIKQN